MKIFNNKGLKLTLVELQTIFRSTNCICHLFFLFVSYLRGKYVIILKNFCQNHMLIANQLKAHEAHNRKLRQTSKVGTKCKAIVNIFFHFSIRDIEQCYTLYETRIDICIIKNRKRAEFCHRFIFRKFWKYWVIC